MFLLFCFFYGLFLAADALPEQTVFYRSGDEAKGRRLFIELKCTACHMVKSDPDLPQPLASKRGPLLGARQGKLTAKELQELILTASHRVQPLGNRPRDRRLPKMPDYQAVLTSEKLIDLITYLKWAED